MKKRVIFYFDGFNFYYGLRDKKCKEPQWQNYFWIDLVKLCQQFFDDSCEVVGVKYFTSPPSSNEKRSRQSAFLNVNKLLNPQIFSVINGQHADKTIDCEAQCKIQFTTKEEKRTDVNIALTILTDCIDDKVDVIVLVSADSDQVPTIKLVKERFPNKRIKAYFPPERFSSDIYNLLKPVVELGDNEEKFKKSMLPGEVAVGDKKYTKPAEWKPAKI